MELLSEISKKIWNDKYRLKTLDGNPIDNTIEDTWCRVARYLAETEKNPAYWETQFYQALEGFKFLPAGRIISGAGTGRAVTLFNCFVMGDIPDDIAGIFLALKEAALTMQQGGGIGYNFSTLRPKGAPVIGVGADASGPLSFMDVWDSMCRTIKSAGSRRGAMMATLRCDHPDIEQFIEAKRDPTRLRMFNLSILITDAFMKAVVDDLDWNLVFAGKIYETVSAKDLWNKIMDSTYEVAEPGVIFIDRINKSNNLAYCESISATNPCGEQPLPPYGACLLGSINLAKLVEKPFQPDAMIDLSTLTNLTRVAVRMLDNVIDVSRFPLKEQKDEAEKKRRLGLGVTGLADALIMCGARYGSQKAIRLTEKWMESIRDTAYRSSILLAKEKGTFPLYDWEAFSKGDNIIKLPKDIKTDLEKFGIRNALLTSIAPTGTISLLADNISSGIEPVFAFRYNRKVLQQDGSQKVEEVSDYAYRVFCKLNGEEQDLPKAFVDAQTLQPEDHLVMQATMQKYIDSSISKTINCPEDISFEMFKDVYQSAYDQGCKGCTTYRPNRITGAVLLIDSENNIETDHPSDEQQAQVSKVVQLAEPLDRPEELEGKTYKIKWPESDHAIYITMNDIVQDGKRRPFEIFINSKNMEHFAWTVALTRMISAVFRRGGDVSFVVEELKAVFDPRGGAWMERRYIPSLLAAIGEVIEKHMMDIGFIENHGAPETTMSVGKNILTFNPEGMRQCSKCGAAGLLRQEGCDLCTSCGYSKCGG
ncbi:MAG: ribonucleoside-diphosphate reductase, adenosylcobalamin-dependent [Rhodospirillaceae bacterium]|nr:ribonucleoside-diphosphate reductase, adenosylcobalamin-dependent [Rhodospirillaceae bacterium]|tara:strand:- start:394 stop:2679 length:2286 start_codon:yes stop_codon:yes gene_type:complete